MLNLLDILLILLLAAALIWALRSIRKRKYFTAGCSGDCASCAASGRSCASASGASARQASPSRSSQTGGQKPEQRGQTAPRKEPISASKKDADSRPADTCSLSAGEEGPST